MSVQERHRCSNRNSHAMQRSLPAVGLLALWLLVAACEPMLTDRALPPLAERVEGVTSLDEQFGSASMGRFELAASRLVVDGSEADALTVLGPMPGGRRIAISVETASFGPIGAAELRDMSQVLTHPDGSLTLVEATGGGGGAFPVTPAWHIGRLDEAANDPGYYRVRNDPDGLPVLSFNQAVAREEFETGADPGTNTTQVSLGAPAGEGEGSFRAISDAASAPMPVALDDDPSVWFAETVHSLTLDVRLQDGTEALVVSRFPAERLRLFADGSAELPGNDFFSSVSSVAFQRDWLRADAGQPEKSLFFTRDAAIAVSDDGRIVRVPFGDQTGSFRRVGFQSESAVSDQVELPDADGYIFEVSPEGTHIYMYAAQRNRLYVARPFW